MGPVAPGDIRTGTSPRAREGIQPLGVATAQLGSGRRAVLGELGDVNSLHRGKVEQAGFAVLKAPQIPSVLVETAFISNPDEEKRLNDETYQEKIARAILRGVKGYIAKNPPLRAPPTLAAIR